MLNIFTGTEYIKFLVYLKGGECVVFHKILPKREEPTVFMNNVTNLLVKAMTDKEVVTIETDNFKESKGKVSE